MPTKKKTPRSKEYLEYVRSLSSCLACKSGLDIQAAHVRIGNGGGMGLKPSDYRTVPLCAACHHDQHAKGERAFWNKVFPEYGLEKVDAAILAYLGRWLVRQNMTKDAIAACEAVAEGLVYAPAAGDDPFFCAGAGSAPTFVAKGGGGETL